MEQCPNCGVSWNYTCEGPKVAKETKIVYWCPYGRCYLISKCEGKGESICVPDSSKDCNKEFLIEEK